jgi:tRNA (guanine10-N2)-dimethyltransferase
LAELESLYGADKLRPLGERAAVLDEPAGAVDFDRLGGAVKLAEPLVVVDTTDWRQLEDFLVRELPGRAAQASSGKLTLGLSVYGLSPTIDEVNKTALALKKAVRAAGRSCRFVSNQALALSSAQVLHNQLFTGRGRELILVSDGRQTYLARTARVQNIAAYAARDQARPQRDARVGMLPPKLAQIIVNLAVGSTTNQPPSPWRADGVQENIEPRTEPYMKYGDGAAKMLTPQSAASTGRVNGFAIKQAGVSPMAILDPFCGTGVILQEALLMGYNAYGTDIEERMISHSRANLDWLAKKMPSLAGRTWRLETGDATNFKWQTFNAIASEIYLGRAFSSPPRPDSLASVRQDVDTIASKFLRNIARQTGPGFRMCLAVPAWSAESGFWRLPALEKLPTLGYARLSFTHARGDDMVYRREGQIVARELVVLQRT